MQASRSFVFRILSPRNAEISPSKRSTAQALLEPMAMIPLDRQLKIFRAFSQNLDLFPCVLLDGRSWSFQRFLQNDDQLPCVLLDAWSWSFRKFSFRYFCRLFTLGLLVSESPKCGSLDMHPLRWTVPNAFGTLIGPLSSTVMKFKPRAPFLDPTAHGKSTLLPRSFCHPFYPYVRLPRDQTLRTFF
jgi:hypothetical protein